MRTMVGTLILILVGSIPGGAAEPSPSKPRPILDLHAGSFRAFFAWRTTVVISSDGKHKPLLEKKYEKKRLNLKQTPAPVHSSPGPVGDWTSVTFDDDTWTRMHNRAAVQSYAGWDRAWLRGKFQVRNPAQIKDLKLTASYRGGIIIYVNGQEIHRAHLPAGPIALRTFAKEYPVEAYLHPNGKLYGRKHLKTFSSRIQKRNRQLTGLAIPAKTLRKGLNVLAIQCVGAPINEKASRARDNDKSWPPLRFAHGGLMTASLKCAPGGRIVPNIGPAAKIAIGNVSPIGTMLLGDYVRPGERVNPVKLFGAKNGYFSGRVVLSSSKTIRGLKATATAMSQQDGLGKIPASAVMIRWADAARRPISYLPANRFDRLLSQPPAEVKPVSVQMRGEIKKPAPAAVVPVWITVQVPKNIPSGDYAGSVLIEAQGTAPVKFKVPVLLKVHDWTLPDSKDFFMLNNIYHSPDSVALYYNVPFWSDRHVKLMQQSLNILKQVGSQICVLNLVVKSHSHGNAESIVRWIKQPDGSYKYDFSLAEKYMDLFEKTVGKPRILEITPWCFQGYDPKNPRWPPHAVTVMDTNGKKLTDLQQPPYGTPKNEAFWRPVLTELRKRIKKRGWWDVAHLRWLDYCNPPKASIVDVAQNIWPRGKWFKNAHAPSKDFKGTKGSMPVAYAAWVWSAGRLYDPDFARPFGKPAVFFKAGQKSYPTPWTQKSGLIHLGIPRVGQIFIKPALYDLSPLSRLRTVSEATYQGNLHGLGMVGGDYWPIKRGRRYDTIIDSAGNVGPRCNTKAMLAPGPKGPVFTERLEAFREGLQIVEAIVALQKAMTSPAMSKPLRAEIQVLLDERARLYLRNVTPVYKGTSKDGLWLTYEATAWLNHDIRLFALTEKATKVIGK
jgi:Glycoside hydrolase 123, catalytic domain